MTKLIFRKSSPSFFSIENVFLSLLPYLNANKVQLPHKSKGVWRRLKNVIYVIKYRKEMIHITGHDHYLLWWPFKNAILTIHDIEALKRKKGVSRWLFQKLWFDLPIRNAKVVTTISNFSKAEILSIRAYQTPIQVIYNPLPFAEQIYSPKAFNTLNPCILHIGVKKNKNLARLLKAIQGISCKLLLIGEPSEKIRRQAIAMDIEVEFRYHLTQEEVIACYQEADLLAFVSTYEGFGLPILEAQAIGRPVITSNIASMPEVAGEGALLVDPFSVASIRAGIQKVIQDKELRAELIQKGLENSKRFEAKGIAEQYNTLYKQIGHL